MGAALEVTAREGEIVSAGDTLAQIDDTALRRQRDQARAGRDIAAAALELVTEGARTEDLEQAREALAAAEENFRLAGEEADRLRALADTGSISEQQLDRAVSAEVQARTAAAQAASALAKLEAGAREPEIVQARAALDQARAALALAEDALEDTRITSPSDGTVLYRLLEPGEWVSPGLVTFVIADLTTLRLTVYVPEPEVAALSLGDEAVVQMDGSDGTVTGVITWISPEAEFTPKNVQTKDERVKQVFAVRLEVANPDGGLKPGIPADARFVSRSAGG
jgi:HlyD family secretion protein